MKKTSTSSFDIEIVQSPKSSLINKSLSTPWQESILLRPKGSSNPNFSITDLWSRQMKEKVRSKLKRITEPKSKIRKVFREHELIEKTEAIRKKFSRFGPKTQIHKKGFGKLESLRGYSRKTTKSSLN